MLGIVTVDDVLDIAEEEATEDIQKIGAVEALEDPYIRTPLFELIRKRAGWLTVLFVGEMLTASAMGFYEDEIKRAVVLALFIPLIISSGGNSGSQAATLIIRSLAIGEVKLQDWVKVFRRELITGFCLGMMLGILGFAKVALWSSFGQVATTHWLPLAFVVAFSLLAVVLWGVITGAMLPFALKRLGLDPASSSAPFVATLVDVTGLVIYFSIASLLLRDILL
jgi:magnesium transporter